MMGGALRSANPAVDAVEIRYIFKLHLAPEIAIAKFAISFWSTLEDGPSTLAFGIMVTIT